MVTKIPRKRVVILILAATLVAGCGMYRKRSANKAIQRVEEKSLELAKEAEAARYASERFSDLQQQIRSAKNKVAAGQYEEAIQEAQEAEATGQRAITEAQATKAKVLARHREIESILETAGGFLSKAREAPPALVPESEMAAAEEEITVVRDLLQQQKKVTQQKPEDYSPIVESASAAFRAAQFAYNLTLQEQAEGVEREVAALRDDALSLEPEKYLPEETEQISDQWQEFDRLIRDQQYEEALKLGETLREVTTTFISVTRQKRATVELEAARNQREKVLAQGAERFALDPMKECERALTEAEEAHQAGQLDETYEAAVRSQEAAQRALTELEAHAVEIVARVDTEIEAAEADGARDHAPEILEEARKLHGDASLALERKAILETIETGQEALERAAAAILQTKKMKAQAALQRSQRSIDAAIEEGAPTYAPEQLKKAQDQYALADQQFKDGAYAEVHDLASLAEELSAQVLEVLEQISQEALTAAEAAQAKAVTAQAESLAAQTLQASRAQLAEARTLLGNRRYRRAIELGKEAEQVAQQAESTAYRRRAEEMMARARDERAEAQKAGAATYAAQTYNMALDEYRQAAARYDAEEYAVSLEHAGRARDLAVTARRKRLDAAIAVVESASSALALQYAKETFNESLTILTGAKQAMEARDYENANQGADRAAALAGQAETATWRARAVEKSDQVSTQITYLTDNLAEVRCSDPLATCRLLLTDTNSRIQTEDYREAYERGVEAEQAAGVARACLADQAVAAFEELSDRSREISALAMDSVGRTEAARLYPLLAEIETALEQEQYRIVFEQTAAGTKLAAESDANIKAHNIDFQIGSLREQLQTYRTGGQAAILPTDFASLEAEVAALNPADLKQDYDAAMEILDGYKTRLDMFGESVDQAVSKQLLSIKQTLTEARQAGSLKYVRSSYEHAVDLYKRAIVLPAGEDYHRLAASIREASEAAAAALSRTLVAIDETGYKDIIRNYMLEMNSLLDRWPFGERRGTGKYGIDFVLAARSTREVDVYRELQRDLSDVEFRDRTKELYTTVQQVKPPPTMKDLHEDVLITFQTVSEAADLFYRYGLYSLYGSNEREQFLRDGFAKLNDLEFQVVTVQARLENLPPPRKKRFWGLFDFERGLDLRKYMWTRYEP